MLVGISAFKWKLSAQKGRPQLQLAQWSFCLFAFLHCLSFSRGSRTRCSGAGMDLKKSSVSAQSWATHGSTFSSRANTGVQTRANKLTSTSRKKDKSHLSQRIVNVKC